MPQSHPSIYFVHLADRRLLATDPFAEADDDTGDIKKVENHIHIRIQRTFSPPSHYLLSMVYV